MSCPRCDGRGVVDPANPVPCSLCKPRRGRPAGDPLAVPVCMLFSRGLRYILDADGVGFYVVEAGREARPTRSRK